MCKFIENIWHRSLIGVVIHEEDETFIRENHFAQRGPLVAVLRDICGFVDVREKAGVGDCWDEIFYDGEVAVADEDGEDFVGVFL